MSTDSKTEFRKTGIGKSGFSKSGFSKSGVSPTADAKAGKGAEARRSTRKAMRTLGEIVPDGRDSGTGCTVLDMSASGARLKVDGAVRKAFAPVVAIPDSFRLLIARDNIAIDCKLAWRDNDVIGVAFTSTFRPIKAAKRA